MHPYVNVFDIGSLKDNSLKEIKKELASDRESCRTGAVTNYRSGMINLKTMVSVSREMLRSVTSGVYIM